MREQDDVAISHTRAAETERIVIEAERHWRDHGPGCRVLE